ncbi:hypothetical protein HK102_013253 [Quaeritorhiza haematococci]|nr:hypothetical protein HK102_013253 [Quaeritorhiza haematococci]
MASSTGYTRLPTNSTDVERPRHASVPGAFPEDESAPEPTWSSSFKAIVKATPLNWLLVFIPLGIMAGALDWGDTYNFGFNFLALVPLAKLLGFATEELALRTSQTIGGLLNATFGNMVELIVSILALHQGLIRVVQASLLGSIISNLLLVLGFCFFCGGMYYKTQKFNQTAAQTSSCLMAISVASFMIPAAFANQINAGEGEALSAVLNLSRGTALVLFVIYVLFLFFQLKTHAHLYQDEPDNEETPTLTTWAAVILLVVSTLLVSVCAEYLVGSIEGLSKAWNLSETFVGLILLPIVGNAAEHVTAVTSAMRNKMELALGVAIGSSTQIALLVTPVTVIAGWMLGQPMTLHFTNFETVCVFVAIFLTNSTINDGTSNWLEGVMLLAAYVILAIAFYCLPE